MSPTSQLTTFFHSPKISIAYVIVECCYMLSRPVGKNKSCEKGQAILAKVAGTYEDVRTGTHHIFDRLHNPTIPIVWRGADSAVFLGQIMPTK